MSSWEFKKNLSNIGKWNKIFLSITCFWALLILTSPLMLDEGETGDLSGSVGIYDNKEIIQEMNPINKMVYYLGDLNCHQLSQDPMITMETKCLSVQEMLEYLQD